MEYKEDLLPSKELNHCIDDFYKSTNFKRADWLNNKQKNMCLEYIAKRFDLKSHHVAWILIKRNYNFTYMSKIK
ncbi:hypothetical protein NRV20_002553 [Staphylococcus pseudintermedius]|nr:hypothetical protein [Staphylococcus pseudintermedius]EJO7116781.1 hypothetical protein [Staphylococcus pseudintermedius]